MPTKRLVPSFDALPPEAKQVADTAFVAMDGWIDQRIDELAADMGAELTSAVTELKEQVSVIEKELTDSRERMDNLLEAMTVLKADIEFGDGIDLKEAIDQTTTSVEAVRKELADREAKWKSIGSGVVDKVTGAIGKVIPFNL